MTTNTNKKRRTNWLTLLLAFGLVAAACGSNGDDSSSPVEDPTSADADEIAASGLTVTAVNIATGTVIITNNGAADADLAGHQLCNRPNYVPLPDQILTPGENIEVSLGGLSAGGGEVGLYTSGDFASSDDLISYVTWGSGGGRLSVAESGGTWSGEPIAEPGDALSLSGDPGSASGWTG